MSKVQGENLISHWNTLIDRLQTSSKDFYGSVASAITERNVPDVKCSSIDWREGGILSAKREYLRVKRKEFNFDICAAPFGNGFFVSWWLTEPIPVWLKLIASIPLLNLCTSWFLPKMTYYRIDTASMFQTSVHAAVQEVIDSLTSANGLRSMSELERKPAMNGLLQR